MKTNIIIAYILAASVSACEKDMAKLCTRCDDWRSAGVIIMDSVYKPPNPPDTAREYMRVDTVELFYEWRQDERGWWQREDNSHGWYTPYGYSHLAEVCPEYLSEVKDTTFDTTWLRKVQVWLTPGEMKRLNQAICEHDIDFSEMIWQSGFGPTCGLCGKKW